MTTEIIDLQSLSQKAKCSDQKLELTKIESFVELERDLSNDHPNTTANEIKGWYWYSFCSESFSAAAITLFIPLILEDLAWRAGTQTMGGTEICTRQTETTPASNCYVHFLGNYIPPVSFALYVQSISVIVQVFSFISLGAFAYYSNKRKLFLTVFTLLGSLMCILFLFILRPSLYPFAAFLTIMANVCFGCAYIFFNAYLPLLVNADPDVRKLKARAETSLENMKSDEGPASNNCDFTGSNERLFAGEQRKWYTELQALRDNVSSKISTYGSVYCHFGSIASIVVLGIVLFVFDSYYPGSIYPSQVCVALTGVWWGGLYLLTAFKSLKVRPGPPFPSSGINKYLLGWKNTGSTIISVSKLRNAFTFLISWFFFSDTLNTIATVAVLFGKSQINMSVSELFIMSIIAPFFAVFGNFLFFKVFYERWNWKPKSILLFLICFLSIIPIYGLLGFFIPESYGFGLRSSWEIYVLGAVFGLLLGAIGAFSRTLYSELIPPGMESEFFALYSITDKGSAWLGPLLVAVMTDSFGNIRYSFFILLLFLVFAIPFLYLVNVDKGKLEAKDFLIVSQKKTTW